MVLPITLISLVALVAVCMLCIAAVTEHDTILLGIGLNIAVGTTIIMFLCAGLVRRIVAASDAVVKMPVKLVELSDENRSD